MSKYIRGIVGANAFNIYGERYIIFTSKKIMKSF